MKINNKKHMDEVSDQKSIFLKIEEGETKLRIMSDVHVVKEHSILVNGKNRFPACPVENTRMRIEAGELPANTDIPPCPLCELGYPVKVSYLAFAVNRKDEEAGVLKKGSTVMGIIQGYIDDEDWGDPKNYDFKIQATGQNLARKYAVSAVPVDKSKPLTETELKSLEKLMSENSLDEMTIPNSYDNIKDIIGPEFGEYVAPPRK